MLAILSLVGTKKRLSGKTGAFVLIWSLLFQISMAQSSIHPLDPLSKEEITRTTRILSKSGKVRQDRGVSLIVLHEPPKALVLDFAPGKDIRREAFAVVYERSSNKPYEGLVDLRKDRVVSWSEVPGMQASRLME